MKKLIYGIVSLSLFISMLCIGTFSASATYGSGVTAVASNVKLIKTGLLGQKLCFTDGDFKSALCLSDFDTVTITEIPESTKGTLLISGRRVGNGRVIKRKHLASLVFVPASGTVEEATFKFTVDGYAGGSEIECVLRFIDKVNYAPKIEETSISTSTLKTQEEIAVYGQLEATDPEGDALEYIIVTYPKNGVLEFTDQTPGKYKYTPNEGYTGKDKFNYVVRDEYGNYTKLETVNIKVNDRLCDTVYRDMEDREEYNAAVAMTAIGVMNGKLLGDDCYFIPDEKITRAEFVTLAMKCSEIRADSSLSETYFDDNEDIPTSLRSYVATAQSLGIISGDFKDGRLTFSPNEEITKYEAAKILASIIGTSDDGEETVFADEYDVPVWARAGVSAMCSLGVFTEEDSATLSETLTRADTASYLYRMMEKI